MTWWAELGSSLLLFSLVFGMSATVEWKQLRKQIHNYAAFGIGAGLQFVVQPFIGFVIVKLLHLPAPVGVILMVVTSSPGGSYSNWWCSMFNAELALSVTMTAISTLLSMIMLPANLFVYTQWTYDNSVVQSLDWTALTVSLFVVFGAIAAGLITSSHFEAYSTLAEKARLHRKANLIGNFAGVSLIALSVTVSTSQPQAALWDQTIPFYIGVALPVLTALGLATLWATQAGLEKPERVAVAIEACFQNTGIATSVALTMFAGQAEQLGMAVSVPLYYGIIQIAVLAIFCIVSWQCGWTKAPPSDNLCVMLANSYEVPLQDDSCNVEEAAGIEIVLGQDDAATVSKRQQQSKSTAVKAAPRVMIFARGNNPRKYTSSNNSKHLGTHVVDAETLAELQERAAEEATESTCQSTDDPLDAPPPAKPGTANEVVSSSLTEPPAATARLDLHSSNSDDEESDADQTNENDRSSNHRRLGRRYAPVMLMMAPHPSSPQGSRNARTVDSSEPSSSMGSNHDQEDRRANNIRATTAPLPARGETAGRLGRTVVSFRGRVHDYWPRAGASGVTAADTASPSTKSLSSRCTDNHQPPTVRRQDENDLDETSGKFVRSCFVPSMDYDEQQSPPPSPS